jgi:hypothetical protein
MNSQRRLLFDALSLRTDEAHLVLRAENVAVQLRNPLFAAHRHVEVLDRRCQVLRHLGPEKVRIALDQISRRGVTELLCYADLSELMEEGIGLAQVVGIAKLADQVCRPHETRLGVNLGVVAFRRHGEAGELNRPGNT